MKSALEAVAQAADQVQIDTFAHRTDDGSIILEYTVTAIFRGGGTSYSATALSLEYAAEKVAKSIYESKEVN